MSDSQPPPAVELRGISSGYGSTTILRGIDLEVPSGAIHCVLGPNGAGKTTLLKTVSGIIRPTAGSVHLDGIDMTQQAPHRRCEKGLCHIPEGRGVFRTLTVRDNLRMHVPPGRPHDDAEERAAAAFPVLGERLDQLAGTLSGGQQQMLALARAYLCDPKLVLVDEASLGLAPLVVDEIFASLEQLAAEGCALLLVDQFVDRALALATHAHILNRGEIVFSGTPAELRDGDLFSRYLGTN